MRFRVILKVGKPSLPLDYHNVVLSYLKDCLTKANDGKYYEKYFGKGSCEKPYAWSVYLKNPKFTNDAINLDGNLVTLTFTTSDTFTGFLYYAAVLENKRVFPLPNQNTMQVIKVERLEDARTTKKEILIRMESPCCIRMHERDGNRDRYYTVEDTEFPKMSKKLLEWQLERAGFSEELVHTVELVPIHAKKTVVLFYGNKIAVSVGLFLLRGDTAVLNYLLQTGIGSRHSSGFGLARIVTE